jgi:hypothetical protein
MRHTTVLATSALAALTLGCADSTSPTAPAARTPTDPQFISAGRPTGTSYGGVGVLFIDEGSNGSIDFLCTGSLISSTVFLTAGHCISDPGTATYYVSFVPDVIPVPPAAQRIQSTTAFKSSTDDIGVVILPAGSTTGIPVYDIPTAGFLLDANARGGLARETAIVVGYGSGSLGRGPLTSGLDGVRKVATTKVLSIQGPYLLIADSHGQSGQGGTCGGDSGGPVFLEGQDDDLIVAITTAGFPDGCHAIGIYTRLDTPTALAFLGQFVAL